MQKNEMKHNPHICSPDEFQELADEHPGQARLLYGIYLERWIDFDLGAPKDDPRRQIPVKFKFATGLEDDVATRITTGVLHTRKVAAQYLRDQGEFDPMTCPMPELDDEIATCRRIGGSTKERRAFLEGIRHARIIIAAGTGGAIR